LEYGFLELLKFLARIVSEISILSSRVIETSEEKLSRLFLNLLCPKSIFILASFISCAFFLSLGINEKVIVNTSVKLGASFEKTDINLSLLITIE